MTDQLPALEAIIETLLYKCQKSKCNSQRGVCRQNGLVCAEMCRCIDSKNELKEYMIE